jgi:hypothetical protein
MEWLVVLLVALAVLGLGVYVFLSLRRRGGRLPSGVTDPSIGGGRGAGPFVGSG